MYCFLLDVDECATIPDLCRNGQCINTLGSYRCICSKGFRPDPSALYCLGLYIWWNFEINNSFWLNFIDINECHLNTSHCQYNCQNTEGSYICSCPAGFILNPDGYTCRDMDECATGQNICQQTCINTEGSYKCACEKGYNQIGDRCQGRWRVLKKCLDKMKHFFKFTNSLFKM